MIKIVALAAGVAAFGFAAPAAAADVYPNRPITFVIGFAPGGPSDVLSRIIGRRMEQELKQPMIIENRAGAGGSLAAQVVSRAAPDGYTVMLGTNAALTINPNVLKNVGYDPEKDFEFVSMIGTQPDVLYVHPAVEAKSFAELVALAKASPGKLNFGSGGIGTPAHLSGELLKKRAGLEIAHVPFRGTGPSIQAVVAGHIQMAFNPPAPLIPFIQAGQVRALAVTSPKRSGALPDVPTIDESGYPGFDTKNWHGLVVPAKTPKEIVDTLRRALHATLGDPAVKKQLNELGVDLTPGSSEDMRALVRNEIPMFAELIKSAGIKTD
ncbi:MAG TPA: tripartite tricarboxylate transporter substrate binding protein [Xanthobacteraceae bacterium]|nr:tripartite tricarboxylate transporter substrate binding protein [Xanthobacteraceae bacterium]